MLGACPRGAKFETEDSGCPFAFDLEIQVGLQSPHGVRLGNGPRGGCGLLGAGPLVSPLLPQLVSRPGKQSMAMTTNLTLYAYVNVNGSVLKVDTGWGWEEALLTACPYSPLDRSSTPGRKEAKAQRRT